MSCGLLFIFCLAVFVRLVVCGDRVKLIDVSAITLRSGEYTVGRKSPSIAQLKCVGGSANCLYEPKVVQCYNRGFDGEDVQWECKAEMDAGFKFGKIQVSCEGYDYPEDPYILKDSCGLLYELEKTKSYSSWLSQQKTDSPEFSPLLTIILFAVVLFFIFWFWSSRPSRGDGRHPSSGDGWDDDPHQPPFNGPPPPPGFRKSWGAPPTYDEACNGGRSSDSCHEPNRSDGSGFYTGLGLGGLAGYLFGRNQYSSQEYRRRGAPHAFERASYFNHGDANAADEPTTSYTTSGFGGTTRR